MMNKKYKTHLHACLVLMTCVVFAVTLLVNVKGIHAGERGPRVGVVDDTHPELFRGVAFFDSSEVRAAEEPAKVDTAGVDSLRVTVICLKAG